MIRRPIIDVICPMVPKGKPRPRFSRKSGVAYTPAEAKKWEAQCAAILSQHTPPEPLDGPVIVDMLCVMPRPGYMRKKDKNGVYKFPTSLIFRSKKPDLDNLYKAVLDVGTTVRYWGDDCQVVCGTLLRAVAEIDGNPRIEIMVSTLMDTPEEIWRATRKRRGSQQP